MDFSEKVVEALRDRLPGGTAGICLRDAVAAMERFCLENPFHDEAPMEDSELGLAIVATKCDGLVEIGIYRSWGLFYRLELLLRYRSGWRSLFLGRFADVCGEGADPMPVFNAFRSSGCYRRYRNRPAESCSVTWQGPDEMVSQYKEIIPALAEAMGPEACDWNPR